MSVPLVTLIVLDGWGVAPDYSGNAITRTQTPNMRRLWLSFPHTTLAASQEAVGLPRGEVGNTETGHLNLGAGRIVFQDLMRINLSIANGTFFTNPALLQTINHAKENNSNLHLMGLLSGGTVHSSMNHLFALLRLCSDQKFDRVFLHLFTDGRDSPPNAAEYYLSLVSETVMQLGVGKVASIMGRYWAMDRDNRWERTEKAYRALTLGEAIYAESTRDAIENAYENRTTDEFVNPIIIVEHGKPVALIKEGDSVIFFNYRIDRPRQLTAAFVVDDFENLGQLGFDPYAVKYHKKHEAPVTQSQFFKRGEKIKNLNFCTMTQYSKSFNGLLSEAFPPVLVNLPLGSIVSNAGLRQLRLAESEKERFVTYYFNGQQEIVFSGEDRIIVPSPRVPTYDQKPEMSAREITETFLKNVDVGNTSGYSFVLINFANTDMVGHTGNLEATKIACGVVDECIGKIVQRVSMLGGVTLITADHGNAEHMIGSDGRPGTEHTANPVPLIITGNFFLGKFETLPVGILADVAPTVLKLLGLQKPADMTGRALV
ncbi:MAG: phosphoglycerate mutase (2,3-diphosphoglycerate-independent) [Candidatus Blackburnbacteria bacterium RIFCSPHIGHO2_02_FULL_39_13]|uniref:2,3-bisphosphoglycerate-independent phosphoglycerate mutase n=1 Tax=Candidatus Blackburnbacteria bacterium RIFCSPLOWO2_01_FULL_40_20 TaxID=1797519 RepID=A0A1G1VCN2_9BACT|nr:MAG: 2,3-bisphosphoglycerate-independent phosphoglycerate mutase [Microgenomates group bacterium GW2011_GWA2_39_19]OGY06977.1 MAG: phosphoglycerate mutase (2,3-diphosphoglycerate-independent) [Candidatus Blackburnbacteria bacterium RIFCSPHIGHO2_01_FULL_40_17]OGY08719.1 MAG: phosphoglycerate mutase (2,3-diphosphoglycerate-independent) [Candidatus Blackburnbacteria bacterium RIFCSPHIGHO2_02_FULL_39_13]OGY13233.1 MAG: phosphoglycerate mutase (2,3-diphosphoglycerate-independent) [Candidatus Black